MHIARNPLHLSTLENTPGQVEEFFEQKAANAHTIDRYVLTVPDRPAAGKEDEGWASTH